jgi:hypothetical protein
MLYEIRGRGGLYPDGVSLPAATAAGAIERYQAIRAACGAAQAFVAGRRVRRFELVRLAWSELTDTAD